MVWGRGGCEAHCEMAFELTRTDKLRFLSELAVRSRGRCGRIKLCLTGIKRSFTFTFSHYAKWAGQASGVLRIRGTRRRRRVAHGEITLSV